MTIILFFLPRNSSYARQNIMHVYYELSILIWELGVFFLARVHTCFKQSPSIDTTVNCGSCPIASSRIFCERGDLTRLKGQGSNFGRDRRGSDSLLSSTLHSHQHGHHSGLFRSRVGERNEGVGQSQDASPTGVARYSSFNDWALFVIPKRPPYNRK